MKRKGQPCLYCHKVPKPPPERKKVDGECLTVLLSTEDLSSAIADAVERALLDAERNGDDKKVCYSREGVIYEAASTAVDNAIRLLDDEETEKILAVLYPDRAVIEEHSGGPEADSLKVPKEKPDCAEWTTLAIISRHNYRLGISS